MQPAMIDADPWMAMPAGMVAPMWAPGVVGGPMGPGMAVPMGRGPVPSWGPMPVYSQPYGPQARQPTNTSWFF
jgi:hypothetical protein